MVDLNGTFDATGVPEDDRNFDPIPAGKYRLQVIESKIEETKTGSGDMLTLTLEVIDGPYKGRRIWDRLNVRNQNPDAQRIAQRALADLCLSINVPQVKDSEQLHFKPFTASVTIQADKTGQYGPQNRVRYATPGKAEQASARPAQQSTQGKPAAAGSTAKPWSNPKPAKKDEMNDDVPF